MPIDYRTSASQAGITDCTFWAKGGRSWATPYLAGVIALGLQLNPTRTEDAVWRMLQETKQPFRQAGIVNPAGFVQAARTADGTGREEGPSDAEGCLS